MKNVIYKHLQHKFSPMNFLLVKGTDVNTMLLQYAEEQYYNERETATTQDNTYESTTNSDTLSIGVNGYKQIFDQNIEAGASSGKSAGVSGSGSSALDGVNFGASANFGFGLNNKSGEWQRVTKPSKVDVDGMPVGNQPRGLSDMRREDYARAGRECGYDYVFVITLSNGKGRIDTHNFILFKTNTVHKNVWLRLRLVDTVSGNYVYRNDIPSEGKTHNGRIGGRVMERAVHKAMREALGDININFGESYGYQGGSPNGYRR